MSALAWTGLLVAAAVLVPMLALAMLRLWVMVLSPESIQGTDLHMLKWCLDEDTRAYAGFHMSFDGAMPYTDIKRSVIARIDADMANPRSAYRRGCDLQKKRFVFHEHYTVEDVTEVTSEDRVFFRLDDADKRELVYRFHDQRQLVGALFDHTVFDGIRMFNETLTPAIQSKTFDSRWLVKARYLPGFSELLILYTAARMGPRYLTHRPMRVIEDDTDQHVLRHHVATAELKQVKRACKAKFTNVLLAWWAQRLFQATDKQTIRFGFLVGMQNPRFRNNYSILSVDLSRDQPLEQLVASVEKQVAARSIEVMPLYDMLSLVDMQAWFKKNMVDCLFSPAVFSRGKGVSKHVDDLFFYVVPTSMPLYCFACTLGDEVTISTTWATPDVSLEQLASDASSVFTRDGDVVVDADPASLSEVA